MTSSDSPAKTRLNKLDNIKGILILLVVLGHLFEAVPHSLRWHGGGIWSYFYGAISIFHMPAFVFISGYLSSQKKSAVDAFRELFLLYWVAHIAWTFFLQFSSLIATQKLLELSRFLALTPGFGLWFLLSLFFWRLSIPLLAAVRKPRFVLFCLCGLALLIGLTTADRTLSTSRTLCFLPFFAAGFWSKQNSWWLTDPRIRSFDYFLFLPAFLVAPSLLLHCYEKSLRVFHFAAPFQSIGLSWQDGILLRAGIFLVAFACIRLFFLLTPSRQTLFTQLGVHSLSIYLTHFYFIHILRKVLTQHMWPSQMWWLTLVTTALCFLIIPLRPARLWEGARVRLDRFLLLPQATNKG